MKYEFDSATTSHAISLTANSIMHSTCTNLVIEKIVCGESFLFACIAGKQMKDLPAGDYVIKAPALCKDCWICIEETVGDGVVAVSSVVVGEVEITNWDELPLGIEAALTTTDCIADSSGEIIGRVGWCKIVDEETGDTNWKKLALIRGAAEPINFDPVIHTEVDCEIKGEPCDAEPSGLVGWGE